MLLRRDKRFTANALSSTANALSRSGTPRPRRPVYICIRTHTTKVCVEYADHYIHTDTTHTQNLKTLH
jgi:hypothetical protein